MPLPLLARTGNPRVYLPGYRSLSTGAYSNMLDTISSGRINQYGTFEAGQNIKVENASVSFNANSLISAAMKTPSYAMEAPLRPYDYVTGGAVTGAFDWIGKRVNDTPVLGWAMSNLGKGLQFLDNAGASLPNSTLANHLATSVGKPDSFIIPGTFYEGRHLTAGEVRSRVVAQWSLDSKGNPFTLAELEARAMKDAWSFGEFPTSADAGADMINRMITNPLNLLFIPGAVGAGVRLGVGAAKLATGTEAAARFAAGASRAGAWARPLLKPVISIGGTRGYRYGYGFATALGRGTKVAFGEMHTPRIAFVDVTNAAAGIAAGNVREYGYIQAHLKAVSIWASGTKTGQAISPIASAVGRVARPIYFPGLNTELQGARLVGASARAWMRGGIQQQIAFIGAEHILDKAEYLFAGADNYVAEERANHSSTSQYMGTIHDILQAVNSSHPLSDHQAVVMLSLLMPISLAGREVLAYPGERMRVAREPNYHLNVAANVRERLNKNMGAGLADNEAMYHVIGEGDVSLGEKIFNWWVDKMEVVKSSNQLSHFVQQLIKADMDGALSRVAFIKDIVSTNIIRRRYTGALRPSSTADYMFEQHFQPGEAPKFTAAEGLVGKSGKRLKRKKAIELSSERTGTKETFLSEMANHYHAQLRWGPDLEKLGLDIQEGGIISKESMEALKAHVGTMEEGQISQAHAAEIMRMGPNLAYENEFWREFGVSLGQDMGGGRFGRAKSDAEYVTKQDLMDRIQEVADSLPSETELYHETLAASKAVGVARNGAFTIKEPPYPMGSTVRDTRLKAGGRTVQYAINGRSLSEIRTREFYRSGIPKFKSAAQIVGLDGGLFKRVEPLKPRDVSVEVKPPEDVPIGRAPTGSVLDGVPDGPADTVSFRNVKTVKEGKKHQAVWYGPDGKPRAYAQVRTSESGAARELSVYVDPAFRRQGVATKLYEELQRQGIDIGSISGSIVTKEGRLFSEAYRSSRPDHVIYARGEEVALSVDKGIISINLIPAEREAAIADEISKLTYRSGPRKGQAREGSEAQVQELLMKIDAAKLGIDTEALLLAAQNNGRVIFAETGAGPLLADYGFVESARIADSTRASYSYRGGDPSKIVANRDAHAFQPYRESKRIVTERGALSLARKDAINGSLLEPSIDYLGKTTTPSRTLFPEERLRFINEQSKATTAAYKEELQNTSAMDAEALRALPFDKRITDWGLRDWVDQASAPEMSKFIDMLEEQKRDWPHISVVPRGAGLIVDPASSRFSMLAHTNNMMNRVMLDYGAMAPIQRFYEALLAPKHVRWLGKQTQTELHNLLTLAGWAPESTRAFIVELRKRVIESKTVEGFGRMTGSHMFGAINALPEGVIQSIAREINPAHAEAVIERYGSYQKMLTEASNRLLRGVARKTRAGGSSNVIERAADAAFSVWQHGPVFRELSAMGRSLTKFTYPYFRFMSDPLFAIMNYIEPTMYAVFNEGFRGLKPPSTEAQRLGTLASEGLIPPGGLFEADISLLITDPAFYTLPKVIRNRLLRNFELTATKRAVQYMDAMGKEHPIAVILREKFGDNVKDWAGEMNRLLANMVEKGPEGALRSELAAVLQDELGYSMAELKTFAPAAERLTEIYRGVYSDLADLYIGRMNRSNVERLSNNFFVAWPSSYLIKATSWMYRILFEKIGPVPGMGGAYLWDQYRQKYDRALESDPNFKQWTEDNRAFLFMLELIMPTTPVNVGISLAKSTRYVGSWISPEIFGSYNIEPGSVPDVINSATRFGPVRTWNMFQEILKNMKMPGFYDTPTPKSAKPMR